MIVQHSVVELDTNAGPMRTHITAPNVDPKSERRQFPAVILFSEIFQRTGPIARMAAMIAGHGFVVAVPEIFHELEPAGTVLSYDQAGADAGNSHKTAKTTAAYDDDARRVLDHLLSREDNNGSAFTMGVCIGGHLAFRCAFDPRIRAAACFYPTDLHQHSLGLGGDDSLKRAGEIQGELLLVWGKQDPHIPSEGRAKIHAKLTESGRRFTWHEFNAQHAFLRDEGPRYDPALARISYQMVVDLFLQR